MNRRKKLLVLAAALLGPALVSTRLARAQLKVVATVPDLAAIAGEIGGARVTVKALSLPTQDPHFVDARPSLALELNRADLLLVVGLELEIGWLPTLLVGARNPRIHPGARGYLDCSQFVHRREIPAGPIDRSMGDIHPGGNPHYLMDPRAGAAVGRGIARRLQELDPDQTAVYEAGLAAFLQRLEGIRARWEGALAAHRGTSVIQYHRTLTYLADWLGLEVVGALEPKPGIPPNPSHVASLLGRARQLRVRLVIQEDRYPDATSRLLADRIPGALVRIPGGTDFRGGQRYADYLGETVGRIARGLAPGGKS